MKKIIKNVAWTIIIVACCCWNFPSFYWFCGLPFGQGTIYVDFVEFWNYSHGWLGIIICIVCAELTFIGVNSIRNGSKESGR